MIKGTEAGWGTCSRTVSLGVKVLALSYLNNSIAVGSDSGKIIILDAITGSQTAVLFEHTDNVNCLTFSSDGKSLVSGSGDKTVKLWDVQTGGVVKTFYGHIHIVMSVSISADYTRIVSGSWDYTVCLWDIQTGECLCQIKHQMSVQHVIFSPMDPQHLIFTSDGKVQWWDINGHQILPTSDGFHIAFSPDCTQFALCNGKVVTVQNSDSRAIVADFHVDGHYSAKHCCFSPDGRFVAAAAGNTSYVWDITSPDPHLIGTFVGHVYSITSLIFSSPSSLISGSEDRSLRIWKIDALSADQVATDPGPHTTEITSVSLQARAGIAISSDAFGVVKIWDLSIGLHKETFQISAATDLDQNCGDAKLIDGRLVFAWYKSGEIHIWDAGKGEHAKTMDAPLHVRGLRILGDGSKVIVVHMWGIQAWHMWTWEPAGEVESKRSFPYLDSFYTDSPRVWIGFECSLFKEGWDFGVSGPSPISFDPSIGRPHLDSIGSLWPDCSIKDTATEKEVFQLRGKYAEPNIIQWDGRYLVAGYLSGEVLILDFHHVLPQ